MSSHNVNKKIIIGTVILGVCIFLFFAFFQNSGWGGSGEVIDTKNNEVIKSEDVVKTVEITNREMVQVRFSWEVGGIKYNDALNILKAEYEKLSAEDIEKMKQERFDNWVKAVNEQSKR